MTPDPKVYLVGGVMDARIVEAPTMDDAIRIWRKHMQERSDRIAAEEGHPNPKDSYPYDPHRVEILNPMPVLR